MSITAKELAEKLGMSAAAVSLALNNKPGVSEITREEVIRAAKENGFDFRKIKRKSIVQKKVAFVIYKKHGAVVGDTQFFSSLTEGVTRSCMERGNSLDIRYITSDAQVQRELKTLLTNDTDGVILLGTEMRQEDFKPFESFPLPLVVLDTYHECVDLDFVLINNIQGAYLATSYLINQRNTQPGYLHSAYSIANFNERQDGFYKAVREHGYSSSGCIVHHLAPMIEGAYQDMRAIIEDIAIIGFDNTSLCELLDPPLTTINVPKQAMGKIAVIRLLSLMSTESGDVKTAAKMSVRTSLVRRASV